MDSTNQITHRIYRTGAKKWNQYITHYNLRSEMAFEPISPLRTIQQIFGSALATSIRIAVD
jgi:hypothetical protein